ncbi:MAG TPA: LytR C-terminal domain-containing protein [Gemmatimonadaceae bacterium]|nr:LytR C-terminal domain-containing protein [Gemmatimonadaceae bacterium]
MSKARIVIGFVLTIVVALGARAVVHSRHPAPAAARPVRASAPDGARAPDSVRIRVQVLNATSTRGLARRATMLLRDRGFDVVETGTIKGPVDTTIVLDLSGHPEWAQRVSRLFAPARVKTRRDSSRYLDIAVLLGTTWRPPAQPFDP